MNGTDFLLDTNVVIGLLKGQPEAIRLRRTGTFKLPDAIVAATAICEGLRLLTLDQAMVKGMRGLGCDI